jgi:hypothetical protein
MIEWYSDSALRKRCQAGLNKGEAAHKPEPDRLSAREASDDAFGGKLAEELGIAFHGEVQRAGTGLGELKAHATRHA